MEIASFRKEFPQAVCLALTATATKQVQHDIVANLNMDTPDILVASFNRPNIFLNIERKEDAKPSQTLKPSSLRCIRKRNNLLFFKKTG